MTKRRPERSVTKRRPIAEHLFDWPPPESEPTLLGSQCCKCGETVFPALRDCPLCGSPDSMESRRLAGSGILDDFAVAERGPEGFAVPYIQAYIRLDDGPVIFSLLTGVDPLDPSIHVGEKMTMTFEDIAEQAGTRVVGWKFHPALESDG